MPGYSGYDSTRSKLGLGEDALDFELGDEDRHLAGRVPDEGDGPLGGEKAEAREVLDVALVEEDVARQRVAADVLEERLASRRQLFSRDSGCLHRSQRLIFVRRRAG